MIDYDPDLAPVGFTAKDLELLSTLAISSRSQRIVEIQYLGDEHVGSTLALSHALLETAGSLTSFVQDTAQAAAASQHLEEAGLPPARFLTGDPLPQLLALKGPVDLLFLAGEIDYSQALQNTWDKLRPGSLVIVYRVRSDSDYLATVLEDTAFETTVLEEGLGMAISLMKN